MNRLRSWLLWVGWQRLTFIIAATPVVAVIAWWMVRLPPPPVETMIPVAPTAPPNSSHDASLNTTSGWLSPLDTVAPSRIAVHVVGAVERPGVYHLGAGARADDVLRAAGGPTSNADLRRVNLAAAVHDGEQLYIPRVGERLPADITPSTTPSITPSNVSGGKPSRSRDSQPTSTVPLIIDVNRATADDLDRLPGIGPSTAKAIIDHRTRNGPFASVDDLLAVRGIGPATLAEIRPWVRV